MSKRRVLGSADNDIVFSFCICHFLLIFFLLIMNMCFFENTCKFCIFKFTIRCCIFSAYYDMFYWSWVDFFAIYMHILHICSTWKTRDGRKCVKKIRSFRGFRTKYLGLECPSGIFPRYSLRQCKCD